MTRRMRTSKVGLELIKSFEGFRARAVELPSGKWTIGYSHTKTARAGLRITPADAETVLREYDLPPIEQTLSAAVLAPLSQNEFDALVSFAFNIGTSAFLRSHALAHLNSGRPLAAVDAMSNWRNATVNGRMIEVDALVRRRVMEQALFLKHPAGTPIAASDFVRPVAGRFISKTQQEGMAKPDQVAHQASLQSLKSDLADDALQKTGEEVAEAEQALKADAGRLTREIGKAHEPAASDPMSHIAEGVSGPTPDEITRAISALANPGDAAPLELGPKPDNTPSEQRSKPMHTPPPFDTDEEDLPPVAEADDHAEVGYNGKTEPPVLIDDLEPIEVDPDFVEAAARSEPAQSNHSGVATRKSSITLWHYLLAATGIGLGGFGLYSLQNDQALSFLNDESRATYLSWGGIVLGTFLIILTLYLAFLSKSKD